MHLSFLLLLRLGFLLLLLAGCCPAPQATALHGTVFSGEVVLASYDSLRVRLPDGSDVTVTLTGETILLDARGAELATEALSPKARVYVVGSLAGERVEADEVRVLGD